MRFMILVKATARSEAGEMPSEQLLNAMGAFNEALLEAGVLLAGEGLHPSSRGTRVTFSGGGTTVVDGPFANVHDLVSGFWLWQVKSKEDAIAWVKRCPFDGDGEIEIRQVFEAEDFGAEFTPDARAKEEEMRERIAQRQTPPSSH